MSVLLKKPYFESVSNRELVEQLEARKKCQKKLPSWFNTPNIYYPKKLHIEQTSSEITAAYKAQLVDGKTLLDVTGGLGVDSYYFSKKIAAVFHFEISKELSEIATYNLNVLGAKNIAVIPDDGIAFLKTQKRYFDWLYIDPSRRNDLKSKVFQLADCIPNVSLHLDLFFEKSDNILIKTSPLLDITKGITELKSVQQIHVVAIQNEVKELLWVLKKGFDKEIELKTINIQKVTQQKFNFSLSAEKNSISEFSEPLSYLYEPNAAIMKSGGFHTIGKTFHLKKLHRNTHLYTSAQLSPFPGRSFQVLKVLPYNTKSIKKLGIKKANITTRNFPISVARLRKDLKIKDGGAIFLFFTTDCNENLQVLQCAKV